MNVRSASKRTGRAVTFSRILATGLLAGCICAGCTRAAEPTVPPVPDSDIDSVSKAVRSVFNSAQNCVVKVEGVDARNHHTLFIGTGFFIDPNGMVYTCYTVGGDTEGIVVSYGEKKYPAKRLLGDPRSGIAILKIDARTPFLPISKNFDPAVATPVLVVGYPMNLPLAPSLGVVAGIDSKNAEGYFLTRHIRANVAVKPGLGGAPMLNLKGEVVGIVISEGDNAGASCYALPAEAVQKIRSDYDRFGEVHHGWIGISVGKAKTASGGSSVVVSNLIDDTPAAKSGLKTGDFVLQIGSKKIMEPEDVLNASFFLTAGDEIPITILRGTEKITVKVQAAAEDQPPLLAPLNAGEPSTGGGGIPLQMPH